VGNRNAVASPRQYRCPLGRLMPGRRPPGRHVAQILVTARERRESDLLARALLRAGYQVRVAADGPDVLAAADQTRPAAVVLDWLTPGYQGLELCLRLKVRSRLRGVPVLLIAARGDGVQIAEGFQAGADEVVTRPLDVPALVRLVNRRVAGA
jgi:two-component system, OmpR family, phosphate regulon response regulator PhoB